MYYALIYETVENYVERRQPHRAAHLELANREREAGRLVLAGAFEPADGALLVFQCETPADVEAFVAADPYVQNGLVPRWTIRKWNVVINGAR